MCIQSVDAGDAAHARQVEREGGRARDVAISSSQLGDQGHDLRRERHGDGEGATDGSAIKSAESGLEGFINKFVVGD